MDGADASRPIQRGPRSQRSGAGRKRVAGLTWIPPCLLLVGHLIGGASDAPAGLALTSLVLILALILCLRERHPVSPAFIRTTFWAGVPLIILMVFAAFSATPGSAGLASGALAQTVGSVSLSIDPPATWLETAKLCGLFGVVLAAERLAASARRLHQVLLILIGTGFVWTLWALWLAASEASLSGFIRLSGGFVSPNVAGSLIVVTLLLLVGEIRRFDPTGRRSISTRRASWMAALVGIVLASGLVLTASRACALLGLGLTVLLWLWPRSERRPAVAIRPRRPLQSVFTAFFCLLLAVGLLGAGTLMSRLSQTGSDAVDRWAIMKIYVAAAEQSPLTGHGLGSAPALSRLLITPDNYGIFWNIRATHNLFVQWWVEAGLLGAALWFSAVVIVSVLTWRGLGRAGRDALAGPIAALAFLLAHGMVDYDLQVYSIALTAALLAGLCLAGSSHSGTYWRRLARVRAGQASRSRRAVSPNRQTVVTF